MDWNLVIGHKEVIDRLQAMLAAQRLPHALLFFGPSGIGKGLVARLLAGEILGESREARLLYEREAHPDFVLVRPEGASIKIDQIRSLQHFAARAPAVDSQRVCIIEEAEVMTVQAANSLLKLLEEPPPGFVFILVAGTSQPLLPTILSRCLKISFQPLPIELLTLALIDKGYDPQTSEVAAKLGGGRMGAALAILAPGGLAVREEAVSILNSLAGSGMNELWSTVSKLDSLDTKQVIKVLEYLCFLLRDTMIIAGSFDRRLLYNMDIIHLLSDWSVNWPESKSLKAIRMTKESLRALGGNANVRLTLESLFINLKDLSEKGD